MKMECPPLLIYRIGHLLHKIGLRRFALFISWVNRVLFATWIPCSCQIGKGVKLGYWGLGIVIHSRASIGDYSVLSQNVTVGRKEGEEAVPIIESDVYVGAGAVVLGGVVVGHDAIVGANSVVLHTVPARTVVTGAPANVVRNRTYDEIHAWKRRRNRE